MAVDMFLKLNGINGEAKDSVWKDSIDILAWSWSATNSGDAQRGGGAGAGKVNVGDISVTKWVDLATVPIWNSVSVGKHVTDGTLVVRKAGENPLEYLTITVKEILITSVNEGGSGGEDRLTENISLNFAKFKIQYKEQSDTGSAGASPEFSFDIAANKAG